MSLAAQLLVLFVRDKSHHRPYITLSTAQFCEQLERAVAYMQHPHPYPLEGLQMDNPLTHAFIKMVRSAIRAGRFYTVACVVVLFYDYLITIDREIIFLWYRKKCALSYLVYLNRYLPLAAYAFVMYGVLSDQTSNNFCVHVFARLPTAMIALSEALIGVMRIAKVAALWRGELRTFWLFHAIICVFIVQTALAILCATSVQGVGPFFEVLNERTGCFIIFQAGSMPKIISHWFVNLVFSVLIFYCVLKKALAVRKLGVGRELTDVLLRDAILFLTVLSAVKIASLVMVIVFPYWNATNWSFNHIADVILSSRLVFNLRAALDPPSLYDESDERESCEGSASFCRYDLAMQAKKRDQDDLETSGKTRPMSVIYIGPMCSGKDLV